MTRIGGKATIDGIFGFDGDYRFLSNFWPVDVEYDDFYYPSVEHAYQAAKTLNPAQQYEIYQAPSPAKAKMLGRHVHIRHDWDNIKVRVMEVLLRQKFVGYHDLSLWLYQTGDKYLEETNTWGDTFWGVCNGKGQNVLGNLLMKVREDIKTLYMPA